MRRIPSLPTAPHPPADERRKPGRESVRPGPKSRESSRLEGVWGRRLGTAGLRHGFSGSGPWSGPLPFQLRAWDGVCPPESEIAPSPNEQIDVSCRSCSILSMGKIGKRLASRGDTSACSPLRIVRPVRGVVLRWCPTAHAVRRPRWIHAMNSQLASCKRTISSPKPPRGNNCSCAGSPLARTDAV